MGDDFTSPRTVSLQYAVSVCYDKFQTGSELRITMHSRGTEWVLERDMKSFEALYTELREAFAAELASAPPFPQPSVFGSADDPALLQRRRQYANGFLRDCEKSEVVRQYEPLLRFLEVPDHAYTPAQESVLIQRGDDSEDDSEGMDLAEMAVFDDAHAAPPAETTSDITPRGDHGDASAGFWKVRSAKKLTPNFGPYSRPHVRRDTNPGYPSRKLKTSPSAAEPSSSSTSDPDPSTFGRRSGSGDSSHGHVPSSSSAPAHYSNTNQQKQQQQRGRPAVRLGTMPPGGGGSSSGWGERSEMGLESPVRGTESGAAAAAAAGRGASAEVQSPLSRQQQQHARRGGGGGAGGLLLPARRDGSGMTRQRQPQQPQRRLPPGAALCDWLLFGNGGKGSAASGIAEYPELQVQFP